MEPREVVNDIQDTGAVLQPRLVLVQDGVVVQELPPGRDDEVHHAVERAGRSGGKVTVYAVDSRLPAPPSAGKPIDAVAAGWVEVEREKDRQREQ
jgi:hypothetical protein